jgi:hypothetical protein
MIFRSENSIEGRGSWFCSKNLGFGVVQPGLYGHFDIDNCLKRKHHNVNITNKICNCFVRTLANAVRVEQSGAGG